MAGIDDKRDSLRGFPPQTELDVSCEPQLAEKGSVRGVRDFVLRVQRACPASLVPRLQPRVQPLDSPDDRARRREVLLREDCPFRVPGADDHHSFELAGESRHRAEVRQRPRNHRPTAGERAQGSRPVRREKHPSAAGHGRFGGFQGRVSKIEALGPQSVHLAEQQTPLGCRSFPGKIDLARHKQAFHPGGEESGDRRRCAQDIDDDVAVGGRLKRVDWQSGDVHYPGHGPSIADQPFRETTVICWRRWIHVPSASSIPVLVD